MVHGWRGVPYPDIWRTINYHKFENFTKSEPPYVPTWVCEFYKAYARFLLKVIYRCLTINKVKW